MPLEHFDLDRFAFLFDVDGTLIDIAPTPDAVDVPRSLRQNLAHLSALTGRATALVSGRSLHDLDHLFDRPRLALVAGHGAEIRIWHDDSPEQHSAPPIDDAVRRQLLTLAAQNERIIVEDKGYSIALHYRLVPEMEQPVLDGATAIVTRAGAGEIELLRGKAVVEIKRKGVDKGAGIRKLMGRPPFAGRRPVYIGDDVTDEDAFAVMPEFDGVAISVGRTIAGARRAFESPSEVRRWVQDLCEAGNRPA